MKAINLPITFSIGVATFMKPPKSMEEVIKLADLLMFDVKNSNNDSIKHEVFMEKNNSEIFEYI